MKLFGSLAELVQIKWRKNGQEITSRPNQSTTYTSNRDIQLPPGDTDHVLVSEGATQTLTGKTIDGDNNTVQDLPVTALKTVLGDANEVILRDGSGVPTSGKITDVNVDPAAAIDASKIADGSVSNTEFQYINSLTSDAQTQISGKVTGPGSSTDEALARFDLTTGKVLQNSSVTLNDSGEAAGFTQISVDNLTLLDNSIQSTNSNGNIVFSPNGTGVEVANRPLEFLQAATPSTPASGYNRLYPKSDGKFYNLNSAGLETQIGAGGTGEISVVFNPNDAGAGWTSTGAGITVATSSTTTDLPLGSSASGALTAVSSTAIKLTPVSGTTDYVYYRWTMPASLKNRKLKVQFEQKPLSGYASGDIKLDVYTNTTSAYNGTAARLALSTDSSAISGLPNTTGRFTTTFDADSSDYLELRFYRVAGTTALNMAGVVVGPGIQPQGAVVEDWNTLRTFTPSTGFGTVTNSIISSQRVGNMLRVKGSFTIGTVTGADLKITLPTGLSIDYTKINTATNKQSVGTFYRLVNASTGMTAATYQAVLFIDGTDTANVWGAQNSQTNAFQKDVVNNYFATGNGTSFEFEVPISEWSGNGVINLAQNDVEYASNSSVSDAADTTSFVYGPAGSSFPSSAFTANRKKRVRFQTPIQPTDKIVMEIQTSSSGAWQELVSDSVIASNGAAAGPSQLVQQNSVDYGAGIDPASVNSTDVDVILARYSFNASTYGAAGAAWNATSGGYKWRLRKTSAGAAVGFGLATADTSGLVKLPSGYVRVQSTNGYGSTNTKIRRYTNTLSNTGTSITYADSATLGSSFTINESGVYAISYTDIAAQGTGISLNSAQLTTNIQSITAADRLAVADLASFGTVCWSGRLSSGDVIRPHSEGGAGGTAALGTFTIVQVAKT